MVKSLNSYENLHGGRFLTVNTELHTDNEVLASLLKITDRADRDNFYGNIYFVSGIGEDIKARIRAEFGDVYAENPEGYAIILEDDITVYAESESGFVYAAGDIFRMADSGRRIKNGEYFVPQGIVYNRPLAEMRYLKVFTPAEWEIEDFKKIVDYCCYCRCNGIMLEISGCMEYKRHPEINEKWVEYCSFMMEYSGRTEEIQCGFDWDKNSIHVENAEGGYLKQDTLRSLAQYCAERGIELIPEVPSLSHCDFLILPYPEIAERQNDPYPDTYCPSNPKSYEILFDVLDEVIDVFHPKHINIGHDEWYSIGICDRCKGRDGAELFADDVRKIHDFLSSRGVRTMFWADKVLNVPFGDGSEFGYGGSPRQVWRDDRLTETIPATYRSIDMLPRDIICINWYSGFGKQVDRAYLDSGYDMVYGNFNPVIMEDLTRRVRVKGSFGGGPSNWSASNLVYMQYNWVLFDLYYTSAFFWCHSYDDNSYDDVLKFMVRDMYSFGSADVYAHDYIEFLHTTTFFRQADYRHDGTTIDYERDTMGKYVVKYEDGEEYEIPVYYNQNISNIGRKWTRTFASPLFDIDFISYGENYSHSDCYYDFDRLLAGASYGTLPEQYEDGTYFRFAVKNPHPEKKIADISFISAPGKENTVITREIRY